MMSWDIGGGGKTKGLCVGANGVEKERKDGGVYSPNMKRKN